MAGLGFLGTLFGGGGLIARAEAIPIVCWQIKLATDADYPAFLAFTGKEENGTEILVVRYPALNTSVYGSETVSDDYRLFVGGRPLDGQTATARRLYRALCERLQSRIEPYVSEERRKMREARAAAEAEETRAG
jgi:hypothetical protein